MKISPFLRKHLFQHNEPPQAEPAPALEGAGGGGSIDHIAELIAGGAGDDEPADDEPEAPETVLPEDEPAAPAPDDELATLKARLAELEGKQPPAEPAKPAALTMPKSAAEATSYEQLDAYEAHVEKMRDWALENWDGYTHTDDDGKTTELTADEIRASYRKNDFELRKGIPQAAAALQQKAAHAEQRKQIDADAAKAYPWISQPETEHGGMFAKLSGVLMPFLADLPGATLLLADAVDGLMRRQGKAKPPTPPAVRPPAPTPRTVPNGVPPGGSKRMDPTEALNKMQASGGSKQSVAAAILSAGLTEYSG